MSGSPEERTLSPSVLFEKYSVSHSLIRLHNELCVGMCVRAYVGGVTFIVYVTLTLTFHSFVSTCLCGDLVQSQFLCVRTLVFMWAA